MSIAAQERTFPSATGLGDIRYRLWIPDEIRAAVQLTHGMAEHIDRYDAFATYLAEHGILVYGQDHAGHGQSTPDAPKGYFGDGNGWTNLVLDMRTLFQTVKKEYPMIPFILFGHSMGSFLARTYASRYGEDFDGYVFSGTAGSNPLLVFGKLIGRISCALHGKKQICNLLNEMSFGSYNKAVGTNRTDFDWLSVNEENVDRYVADPLCGFPFTAAGMLDLFDGLTEITGKNWAKNTAQRPMLLISGQEDPVGGKQASGVLETYNALKGAGRKAECIVYPGMRHEILQETRKDTVFADVLLFIETIAAEGETA